MNIHATQAIEALGDTAAVARLFGISMASVSGWKQTGIPPARLMYLQAVAAHRKKLIGIDLKSAAAGRRKSENHQRVTQ